MLTCLNVVFYLTLSFAGKVNNHENMLLFGKLHVCLSLKLVFWTITTSFCLPVYDVLKIWNQSDDTLEQDEWPSKVICNPGLIPIYADILQALGYGSTSFMSLKGKSITRCLNPSLSLELSLIMNACAKFFSHNEMFSGDFTTYGHHSSLQMSCE